MPPAVEVLSLNCWTLREVPSHFSKKKKKKFCNFNLFFFFNVFIYLAAPVLDAACGI